MVKPIVTFTVSPSTITRGESAKLIWSTSFSVHIYLTDLGRVTPFGSKTVSPTSTKKYTLTATNPDGTTAVTRTLTVEEPPPPEPPPPEPPPPEPPPPKPPRYKLTLYTTPGTCRFELLDKDGIPVRIGVTLADGSRDLGSFPEGTYTLKVSKSGYNDYVETVNLNMDREIRVTLDEETVWDWIIGFVIEGIEKILGLQKDTLMTLLSNVWAVMTNFFGSIYDFFSDVVGSIVDIVKDKAGDIFDWLSTAFFDFIDWIVEIGGDIAGFVGDKIAGALDFLTDKLSDFFDWVGDLVGSVADYIKGAIAGFVDWTQDQLGSIWTGIQVWFTVAIAGFVDAFFSGLNTGIEQAKGSPLHSDEPVRNPVLKGLQKVVREHRKKYGRNIITGEKKNGTI